MATFPIRAGQPGRSDPAHENKCTRCGISCHLAVPINNVPMVVPGLHCKFLKAVGDKFECSVYDKRFEMAPWCHHADVAVKRGYLSRDCAYTREKNPGVGKVKLSEEDLIHYWPILLDQIQKWGVPEEADAKAIVAEVSRREGRAYALEEWPERPGRLRLLPSEERS